jgi:hypothetical protein
MSLDNDEIRMHVDTVTASLLKGIKLKPEDEPVVNALRALVTNLLQNISDLAYCATCERQDREEANRR